MPGNAHESGAKPADRHALLAAHPLFRGLDKSLVELLAPRAVIRKLTKGSVLFRKGDAGSALYAVVSGAIRISAPSGSGKDTALNLMVPGDVFGEIALLDGGPRSADATAVEDCTVMIIERREFMPLLHAYPALGVRLIEILCARLRQTSEHLEDVVFLDIPKRLAKAILFLHERAGVPGEHGPIAITQSHLSEMVGASRESTNRQLRQWQKSGLIRLERGRMIVCRPHALAELAEEG